MMYFDRYRSLAGRASRLGRRSQRLASLATAALIFGLLALLVTIIVALSGGLWLFPALLFVVFVFLLALPALGLSHLAAVHEERYDRQALDARQLSCLMGETSWDGVSIH